MDYSVMEVVNKLHEYYRARDRMKTLKLELIKIAIDLGQDQRDAMNNLGAIDFLDGFLVGKGVISKQRNNSPLTEEQIEKIS